MKNIEEFLLYSLIYFTPSQTHRSLLTRGSHCSSHNCFFFLHYINTDFWFCLFDEIESAGEDEDSITGGIDPSGDPGGNGRGSAGVSFPLKVAAAMRPRSYTGGFLRGPPQHVSFDPEAPPPPPLLLQPMMQTTNLLEKPDIDKKVKVSYDFESTTTEGRLSYAKIQWACGQICLMLI